MVTLRVDRSGEIDRSDVPSGSLGEGRYGFPDSPHRGSQEILPLRFLGLGIPGGVKPEFSGRFLVDYERWSGCLGYK